MAASDETSFFPSERSGDHTDPFSERDSTPVDFGRYRILRELGRGAMGVVFLADDQTLGRQVALKLPRLSGLNRDAALERFHREAQAAATLNHPNISQVYDVGEHDGRPFITMALVRGISLAESIRGGQPMNERLAAAIARKIAMALDEAHSKGIIHLDLKPGNIMIDARSEPIVMDFGLAKVFCDSKATRSTQTSTFAGTPAYMSPEQIDWDESKIGPQSDLYSLGIVIYEMLTGDVPFTAVFPKVFTQILLAQPDPPSKFRAGLDSRLEALCLKLIEKSPADRLQTMREVTEVLTEVLRTPAQSTATPVVQSEMETAAVLKAQTARVHQFAAAGKWLDARELLRRMVANDNPLAANYCHWASEQLTTVEERINAKRAIVVPIGHLAKRLFDQQEYAAAARELCRIEDAFRTPHLRDLLQECLLLQTEVDHLYPLIERRLQSGQTQGLLTPIRRLLQLKPSDPVARFFLTTYQKSLRTGGVGGRLADALAPSKRRSTTGDNDVSLRRWLVWAAMVGFVCVTFGFFASDPLFRSVWRQTRQTSHSTETTHAPLDADETTESTRSETDPLESDETLPQDEDQSPSHLPDPGTFTHNTLPHVDSANIPGMIPAPKAIDGVENWQLITRAIRHPIKDIEISPDQTQIAVAAGAYIRLLDYETLKLQQVLVGLTGNVRKLSWRADGQQVVAGDADNRVLIWNRDGTLAMSLDEPIDSLTDLDWSPDGQTIAISGRSTNLLLWNPHTNDSRRLEQSGPLRSVAWNPDGTTLAVGLDDATVFLDADDYTMVKHTSPYPAWHLRWSPDGNRLAGKRRPGEFAVQSASGEVLWTQSMPAGSWGNTSGFAWSSDSRQLAAGRTPSVAIHDDSGTPIRLLKSSSFQVADWSGDGSRLVLAGVDGAVELFDTTSWQRVARLAAGRQAPLELAFNGRSDQIASAHSNSTFAIWSVNGSTATAHDAQGGSTEVIAWNPVEDHVLTGSWPDRFRIWDIRGKRLQELPMDSLKGYHGAAWSNDGKRIWGGGNAGVIQWDVHGKLISTHRDVRGWARIVWCESLRSVACAQDDRGIWLWNTTSQQPTMLSTPIPASRIAWNDQHGQFVVCGRGDVVRVDSAGKQVGAPLSFPVRINRATWSTDGSRVVGIAGRRMMVQNVEEDVDGESGLTTSWHTHNIHSVGHSDDDRFVATAGEDGLVILRDRRQLLPIWIGLCQRDRACFVMSPSGALLSGDREKFDQEFLCLVDNGDGRVGLYTPQQFRRLANGVASGPSDISADVPPSIAFNEPATPTDLTRVMGDNAVFLRNTPAGASWTDHAGIRYRYCPPGRFANAAGKEIKFTKGFWISETEITRDHWYKLMKTKPWIGDGDAGDEVSDSKLPVTGVTYRDCIKFTDTKSRVDRDRKTTCRLPTEAMWEYACRAGTTTKYSFGSEKNLLPQYAWLNVDDPQRVAVKKANPWGLFDMYGNVHEVVLDTWHSEPATGVNPIARFDLCKGQVNRGGSYASDGEDLNSFRKCRNPFKPNPSVGFRIVIMQ